jgi:hypothetical protein
LFIRVEKGVYTLREGYNKEKVDKFLKTNYPIFDSLMKPKSRKRKKEND